MLSKKLNGRKGFTLLEVAVACVIVAIVSVVGLNAHSKSVDDARVTKAKAELASIEIAMRQYNLDYPTAKITKSTAVSTAFSTLKSKGYLDVTPEYSSSQYGCTYSFYEVSTSKNVHIQLTGCKFASGAIKMF